MLNLKKHKQLSGRFKAFPDVAYLDYKVELYILKLSLYCNKDYTFLNKPSWSILLMVDY